jgi:hypothetical protein
MRIRSVSLPALFAATAALILVGAPVRGQVMLTADYSSLGTVYQDAAGAFYNTAGAGRDDITSIFKANISATFDYFSHSILLPWSEQISFTLFDFGNADTVGDSGIDTVDANGRPATSTIRFNLDPGIQYFVDPTPFDNSEFTMSFGTASLGGGQVNNQRFGDAVVGGVADGRWDFLTLVLHETEHSMGISSGLDRFLDLAGPTGTPNRQFTIPASLSGLPSDFDIPVSQGGAHFVGDPVSGDTFGYMTTADPGWQKSQRALPTALDILAVCQTEGCTQAQVNTSLFTGPAASVPEPGTLALLAPGLLPLLGLIRRRRA